MSVFKRHFRVDSGALIEQIGVIRQQREACASALQHLLPTIGAKEAKFWRDGSFASFVFESDPNPMLYRNTRHGWVPKKNSPEGKALWAQIKKLPASPHYQGALKHVGLNPDVPCLVDDAKGIGYWPVMGGFPSQNIWFVEVPWRDMDPAELEQYVAERAAGRRVCAAFDHLLWTPPSEWVEVKHWQYLKEWDELSEAVH